MDVVLADIPEKNVVNRWDPSTAKRNEYEIKKLPIAPKFAFVLQMWFKAKACYCFHADA